MRASRFMQRALAAMLVLSLFAVSLAINPAQAQAAKNKKIILYQGENDVIYHAGKLVTDVTSSSKKTVTANPKDGLSTEVILKAKKTGKATVTVKMPDGVTHKLSVTVKKPDFETDLFLTEGGIVFSSTNHMPQYFRATVECTLKDAGGKVLWQKSVDFDQLPEKTDYYYSGQSKSLLEQIDLDKSTVKIKWFGRHRLGSLGPSDLSYVCNDVSDKIKSSVEVTTDEMNIVPKDSFAIELKNPTSRRVIGVVYLMFYDEDDNLLRLTKEHFLLNKKETDTETVRVSTGYDHYEMFLYAVQKYMP